MDLDKKRAQYDRQFKLDAVSMTGSPNRYLLIPPEIGVFEGINLMIFVTVGL
jgi:hypothetical protein